MIRLSDILCESCWDGYKQVGMKELNGKMVPNCVPVEELYVRPESEVDSDMDVKPETEHDRERGMFGAEESMQDEDHEVSMAQSALDDIIKNATELKQKIGEDEMDLPAWIQDHISQSQNFISQANTNYHEYGQEDDLDEGDYCSECLMEVMKGMHPEQLGEAEYHGRKVSLGKIMRGDVKKFKVFVRDPSSGNVKKVNFGDPNMRIKKNIPGRRKSFRARHHCESPGPRTKARYWACRTWEEQAGPGGGGGGAGAAAGGLGLVGQGGVIRGAPKPKDVKKMRKALNKEKKHD